MQTGVTMTTSEEPTTRDLNLNLTPVFGPAQAAEILSGLGLTNMTECALKTRAYRKQVPFHMNGRRIIFTLDDLREIAEGEAHRPEALTKPDQSTTAVPRKARRRQQPAVSPASPARWRARGTRDG